MNQKCPFYKDGKCGKDLRRKCRPSSLEWCDEEIEIIDADQMCAHSSAFGNYFMYITEEQIEALKNGKVLFRPDEYGMFIGLRYDK